MKKICTITTLLIGLIASLSAQGITNTLGGNTADDKFIVENSASDAGLVVTGEGNVGIGTTSPNARMHLKGDNFPNSFMFLESNTDNDAGFRFIEDGTTMWHIFNNGGANSQLNIRNNAYQPCLTIDQLSGNVGIGTVNPQSKLSVGGDGFSNSTIYGLSTSSNGRGVRGEASGNTGIGVLGTESGDNGVGVWGEASGNTGIGVTGTALYNGNSTNYGGFFKASGTTGYGCWASGKAYDFYAAGSGENYGSASSIRWKTNIVEIDNPLEKLAELRGVYFDWDEEHGGEHDVGMIAEEVGKVLPEIVVYEENGIDANGMDYSKLTPLLVEAIKALQKRVEELEGK